jgi:hypothetical protein
LYRHATSDAPKAKWLLDIGMDQAILFFKAGFLMVKQSILRILGQVLPA